MVLRIKRTWKLTALKPYKVIGLYKAKIANYYFWRTYDQKEIDLIEESNGVLSGYELKWSVKTAKTPDEFLSTYKNSTFHTITPKNYLEFIV